MDESDANKSSDMFFNKVNVIIDKYMPLRKMTQRDFKRKFKRWITDGILNSVTKFIFVNKFILFRCFKSNSPDSNDKIHVCRKEQIKK